MTPAGIALTVLAVVAGIELAALVATVWLLQRARARLAAAEAAITEGRAPPSGAVAFAGGAVRALTASATRLRHGGIGGLLAGSLDDLEQWAQEERAGIVRVAAPNGTTTIAFTDIEDSTSLNDRIGDRRWLRVLRTHERVVTSCVTAAAGHIVKNQGDGFMIVFPRADDALAAAAAIQQRTTHAALRERRPSTLTIRIGMHTGTVVSRSDDFFGRNVAIAARVAAEAEGGQILATRAVIDAAGDNVPVVQDLGERQLRGIRDPVDVVAVSWR